MTKIESAQSESRDIVAGEEAPVNIEKLAQDYSAEARIRGYSRRR
jgi:hypothetical protein